MNPTPEYLSGFEYAQTVTGLADVVCPYSNAWQARQWWAGVEDGWLVLRETLPYPNCKAPQICKSKGYCSRDITCGD